MLQTVSASMTVAALGLALSTAAMASPSESDKATARRLVAVGDDHFARVDYHAALDAYRGADEMMHVPTTSILVAKTLVVLGRLLEAKALLSTFERDVAYAEPRPFVVARAEARALHHQVSTRIPRLTLVVEPDGTAVTLDGRPVATGAPLEVDPGSHRVEVTTSDGVRATRDVVLVEGSVEQVAIMLPMASKLTEDSAGVGETLAWTGLAVLGAGAIVGGVFGGLSLQRVADAEKRCPTKALGSFRIMGGF